MKIQIQAVPTHIITGFLGAGKTTLLKAWLATKPENEVWAVLMNEFGQIGLDQTWIEEQGIAVKEVLGGCLCCTSNLPMQITLARLLSDYKPDRLFIEPTGLGHPQDLLKQLTEVHWQNSLSLRQVLTVIDGSRLHEKLWEQHEIFTQQMDVADHIIISHADAMQADDHTQLAQLKNAYTFPVKQWHFANQGQINFSMLDQAYQPVLIQKQNLLTQQVMKPNLSIARDVLSKKPDIKEAPKTLPYYYVAENQGYTVVGWHLPKAWRFDADQLLHLLQQLKGWERIKAKLHTDQGWLDINAIPKGFAVDFAAKPALDQRLEIITQTPQDWLELEQNLLSAKHES